MRAASLILAAHLALGLAGAASAAPLPPPPASQDAVSTAYVKWKAKHGHKHAFKGNRGRHLGWVRGRHRGWYR